MWAEALYLRKIGSVAIRIILREPQKLIKTLRDGGVIARVENESVLLDVLHYHGGRHRERDKAAKRSCAMNRVIIGTAGHIDHGKTTIIKELTGLRRRYT